MTSDEHVRVLGTVFVAAMRFFADQQPERFYVEEVGGVRRMRLHTGVNWRAKASGVPADGGGAEKGGTK